MTLTTQVPRRVGTVTGQNTWSIPGESALLVDCCLFQGLQQLRPANWKHLRVDPASIDAVVLTHAHIDLRVICLSWSADGFRGKIQFHVTEATYDL